jgi:hypothetical protein
MRREMMAATLALLFGCNPVFAQVGGMAAPTPVIGATSPLGITPNSPTSPVGIPMGATELASPGLSPALTGTLGMTGGGMTCGALGDSSSTVPAASSTYDGGGMAMGNGSSLVDATAIPGMCGTASSSSAPTTTTLSPSPGGASKAGIPLGSVEIGNAGISPMLAVPAPSPLLSTMGYPSMSGTPCSTTGSPMSSTGC